MTLDRLINLTVKGHFCSLLISNIFCYPHFRYLPLLESWLLLVHWTVPSFLHLYCTTFGKEYQLAEYKNFGVGFCI